jgi:hypothetical protein
MIDVGLRLLYIEDLPASFFDEFEADLEEADVEFASETRPNEAFSGLESYLPAAIAIYIIKPFVDEFLKRAATDANDKLYPCVKNALARLVKRVFVAHRPLRIGATAPNKVTNPEVAILALHSQNVAGRDVKFVFLQTLAEDEFDVAIEKLLTELRDHYTGKSPDDPLGKTVPRSPWMPILMTYDLELRSWKPYDPIASKED